MILNIKVECPCGTRFAFEVMPRDGRMPVAVNCPACGADDTELANALIQQQLSAAAAAPQPQAVPVAVPVAQPAPAPRPRAIPVAIPEAQPAPAPAPAAGLKVAGLHKAQPVAAVPVAVAAQPAAEASAQPAAQPCPKHKTETAVEHCRVCGKPICLKCMEMFGYVCSVYCRQQAAARRIDIPVYANQKTVIAGRANAMAKRITTAVAVLIVLLLGFWFWYAWFARNPKMVYSLPIPKEDPNGTRITSRPDEFYQLIGPGQLLSIKGKQLSVFDVAAQHQLWSTPLGNSKPSAATESSDEGESDYYFGGPRVVATSNDVWVASGSQLLRFDRQTGSPKDSGIKDKILKLTVSPDAILVVSGTPKIHETLSEISLPDGSVKSEDIVAPPPAKTEPAAPKPGDKSALASAKTKPAASGAKLKQVPVGQLKTLAQAAPAGDAADAADAEAALAEFDNFREPYIAAGENVVEFKTKLLEHKTVSHAAMKPKGKSLLDNGNINASQGLELAQEMMNDARREETGGVETEDVSRYSVTVHRLLEKGVPDWTNEVTGPPQFFALKTVDVLTAGQNLYVFNKQNKKLWESKLTFPAMHHFYDENPHPPSLETKDSLFFADAGTLTRFDLATGNVRWRFTTVGISRIVMDDRGGLYIVTTTAGPDAIQYSQQINVMDKVHPIIMKLDPATSKVLWQRQSLAEDIMVSGKFLYATRVSMAYAALHLEQGPDTHYNLYLLDKSNGNEIWNFHRGNRAVLKTEVQKNWILVHMDDEVVVMKFFSL